MRKILIVHNYYQIPGGEDTVVANEKRMLEENGHEVVFYSRHNSELKQMHKFRKLLLPFTTIFNPRTYWEIKKIIKERGIEIVHVHNTLNLVSPSVYYAAAKCGVPVVQTVHNFRLLCPGATFYRDGHICEECVEKGLGCAVKHNCYRNSMLQTLACVISTWIHRNLGIYGKLNYIALTEFNREKLLQLKHFKPERVFVKPNFGVVKEITVQKSNQVIFVGRLDKLKGIDVLLNAWKLLGDKAPKLTICGTGPEEEWCRDFVQKHKLNVDMMGFVSNKEAITLISESKALILPTLWYEGFPMTILEAYSVGTPVIGSDLGNTGVLVEDGINGIKFHHNSPEALMEAIARFECLDAEAMGINAYKLYKEKYTEKENYKALKKIYEKIVV